MQHSLRNSAGNRTHIADGGKGGEREGGREGGKEEESTLLKFSEIQSII
jgi:hypothetical protein